MSRINKLDRDFLYWQILLLVCLPERPRDIAFILVGDYLSLRGAANKIPGCNYCLAGPNFYTHGVAFAVPKSSPWLDDIYRVVIEMKTNGSVSMIEKRYVDKMCSRTSAKDLSILSFSGLFLTVAIAIAVCFLALLAEVIAIFILVQFRKHLGVVGKFSMRFIIQPQKRRRASYNFEAILNVHEKMELC